MADLAWMRQNGLEAAVRKLAASGVPVLGVCGGYQMLGQTLDDPDGVEGGGSMAGMGLLPCATVFAGSKTRTRVTAAVEAGPFAGARLDGYEIHMGRTRPLTADAAPFARLADGREEGAMSGQVFGTYLHGLFDTGELTAALADWLLRRKGLDPAVMPKPVDRNTYRQQQYDRLAEALEQHLDLSAIWRAMEERCHG